MTDWAKQLLNPGGDQPSVVPAGAKPAQRKDWAAELLGKPEQPPVVDQPTEEEPGFLEGMYGDIKESITGDKRRLHDDWEEVPVNVQMGDGNVIPIQDHMSMARDNNLARTDIFKKQLPDANVYWDENMIPYTDYFGKPRYLNTPGASMGDLSEVLTTGSTEAAGAMTGAGIGAAIGKKISVPIIQAIGAGAGLAGVSVGQDKIAEVLGSQQGIDEKRAALMGVFGLGGEAGGMLLSRFFSRLAASRKMSTPDGKLTKRGKKILEQNNIDPDGVTPQFVKAWSALADDAVDPAHAVSVAEAGTLPHKVRMSKGDITRDVDQQAFEIGAVKGSRGEAAKLKMQAFREAQQDDLIANEQAIQTIVGAGDAPRVGFSGEGMERAQQTLATKYKGAKQAVRDAYNRASEMGASVKAVDVTDMGRYLQGQMSSYNPATAAKTFSTVKRLMPDIGKKARPISVNIKHLESVRQQLSKITRGTDPVEGGAARRAISSYDKYMDALMDRALILGDESTLSAYKAARRGRAKVGSMFESDRLMSTIMDTQRGVLKLTPDESMNAIFTASGLGAKKSAVRTLQQMRRVLGKDSTEWGDLREEAIMRLFQTTRSRELRGGDDLTRAFSPAKFVSAMDDTFMRNRSLMDTLFTKKEQGLLRQLRNTTARMIPRRGADNFSNTAAEVTRIMQGVFGGGASITRDILKTMSQKYRNVRSERLVDQAIDPINIQRVPDVRALPPGSIGGLSGIGAGQIQQPQQRRPTRR